MLAISIRRSRYLSINKNMHSLYKGGMYVINLYCCRSRVYDVQMCVKTKYCNIASKKKKSTRRWRFITLLHVLCRNCNAIQYSCVSNSCFITLNGHSQNTWPCHDISQLRKKYPPRNNETCLIAYLVEFSQTVFYFYFC